jgi:hypothetical protein
MTAAAADMEDVARNPRQPADKPPATSHPQLGEHSLPPLGRFPSSVSDLADVPALGAARCGYERTSGQSSALAESLIEFLTKPGDFVLDQFADSNTAGGAAQSLMPRWISKEAHPINVAGSRTRFAATRSA